MDDLLAPASAASSTPGQSLGAKAAHRHRIAFAAVLAVAATLLFWRLGAVYLWQDEAVTAVLGERLIQYGKPLSWDGRNVVNLDNFAAEDVATVDQRTGSAEASIRYLVARGDFKPDTTWVFQPWGHFVAAGASLAVFGHGTWQARLPFAAAALLTILLLYAYAARLFEDRSIALIAAALLTANGFWILHGRQCRYYALSSLALLVAVMAYDRWKRGARFGAAAFVAAGCFYFQVDFGSFFPSMAVLGVIAIAREWPRPWRAVGVFGAIGVLNAPFAWYHDVYGRRIVSAQTPELKFLRNLFNLNAYVLPLLVLVAAVWFLWRERDQLTPRQHDALLAPVLLVAAMLAWVPAIAPSAFLRYIVQLTPLACLVSAWTVVRTTALAAGRWRTAVLATLTTFTAASGVLAWPVTAPIVYTQAGESPGSTFLWSLLNPALPRMYSEIFVPRRDPNRAVVEFLQERLRSGDEVLANYEDVPLIFYTGARIRGGITAFRVEDRGAPPARFLVLRRSVPFVHWPVFVREMQRWEWKFTELDAPDVPFGNNPDPTATLVRPAGELFVGELIGEAGRAPRSFLLQEQ